jgi:hypothetical protein
VKEETGELPLNYSKEKGRVQLFFYQYPGIEVPEEIVKKIPPE